MMDDYEVDIDESTFAILSAIANAKDDPNLLADIAKIDPREFREFLIDCGEIDNPDALELLNVIEKKHAPAKSPARRRKSRHKGSTLFVGNLSFSISKEQLGKFFAAVGTVESVSVVQDRDTGRSRGFGFVEMATPEEAAAAIQAFDGKKIGGRSLTVNEAKPRTNRPNPGRGYIGSRRGYAGIRGREQEPHDSSGKTGRGERMH